MAEDYLYSYGLPFSEVLGPNLDELDDRVFKDNKAAMILIDGGIGEGKTTLAVHIADYINKKHGLAELNFKQSNPQLSMGGEDFIKKLVECQKESLPVLIYDEAGDFNKRGSLTKLNAVLNRTFETYRAFKIIVILCLPNFSVLDNSLFEKNIPRCLIHVNRLKGRNYGKGEVYNLYRMSWVRAKMKEEKALKSLAYNKVKSNFYIQFLDLPPARSKALSEYSVKNKINLAEKASDKYEGLITRAQMADATGKSKPWLNNWFYAHKDIKAVKQRGLVKFYNKEVLDRVLEDVD